MNFKARYKFDAEKDLIGKGGFARVFKAFDTVRNRTVALKFYHGIESDKYDIINEINRMDDIVHPNLIRYYDADIIEGMNAYGEKEKIQVGIMEYANAGDLSMLFKHQQSPELIKNIVMDILKGLQFLHMNNIIHRDLKPKNILLSKTGNDLVAKIADFGISKRMGMDDSTASSQLLGSVEYMAPEQFAPAVYGYDGKIDTNTDLWSFGIIVYEIFALQLPFGSRTKGITYEQILNNILFKELEVDYSLVPEPYRSVLQRCLVKQASKRAKQAEELIDIMNGVAGIKIQTPPIENLGTKTQILTPPPPHLIEKTEEPKNEEQNNSKNTHIFPQNIDSEKTPLKIKPINVPPVEIKPIHAVNVPTNYNEKLVRQEISVGKSLFQLQNYTESFKILDRYYGYKEFDTEAKFYLGYMYYNGKCGGTHDVSIGRAIWNEAKQTPEDRDLITELMLRYVLKK